MNRWEALAREWWSIQLQPPSVDGLVPGALPDTRRRQVEAQVTGIVEREEAGALPHFLRAVVETMPEGGSLSLVGIGLVEEAIWHDRELTALEVAQAGFSPTDLQGIVDSLYPEDQALFASMLDSKD